MAKFNVTTSNQYISGYVEYIETFGDNYLETNKSTVTATLFLHRTNNYSGDPTSSTSCSCSFVIDGATITKNLGKITIPNGGAYVNCGSASKEITHKDDGSKEITISVSYVMNYINLTANASSSTIKLTTIPRASSIAISNYNLGQNIGIVIGRKSDAFTHKLTYKIGSRTGDITSNTNLTNYPWEMSADLINQIKNDNPTNKEVDATVYCTTLSGGNQIGDIKEASFKLYIIDKPVVSSVTRAELNSSVSALTDKVLRHISLNQFTITATAPTGTSINNYRVRNGTQDSGLQSSNIVDLNDIQAYYNSGDNLKTKFVITCIDARGNTSDEYLLELDFINYVNVSVNKTDTKITRSTNTSNDAFLNIKGNFYNNLIGDVQNELNIQYKFKQQGTSDYSELVTISAEYLDNTFQISNLALEGEFDYQKNYEFIFYLKDSVNSIDEASYTYKTSEAFVIAHEKGIFIKNIDCEQLKLNDKDVIVIESGSDSNGSWTKYDDGTIEEWGTYTISSNDVSWTALTTGLYYSPSYSHKLPITLINTDNINTTCAVFSRSANFDWAVRPSIANTDAPDISVTDTLLAFNLVTATNTKRNVVIRWFVKGRWKE